MSEQVRVDSKFTAETFIQRLSEWDHEKHPKVYHIESMGAPTSRAARGLYWCWLREISERLNAKMGKIVADKLGKDMHDYFKHQFLGYEDKRVGNVEIRKLKSTSDQRMKGPPFYQYMEKIDHWAADKGWLLERKNDNEYSVWKAEQ